MDEKRKTSILVVDDDSAIRKLLERIAVRAGFEVGLAKDGIEALEILAARSYDIVVVDLMMPRLSGYELVQKISAITPRPIIIVATALTNGATKSLDDSLIRRVIRKPFDVQSVAEALIETAQQIVTERQADIVTFDPATGTVKPKEPD